MPDFADASVAPELPDLFTPSQQLLLLLCISNRALLSRPLDPLPRALAKLTDYDQQAVDRIQHLKDSAGLYALLREEPQTYATHLLLGRLTYASPLAASLIQHLVPEASADADTVAERRAELLAYVAYTAAWNSDLTETYLLTGYAEEDQAEAQQERADFRAAIEAAFADWQHSLGAVALEAPAPVLPPNEAESGWSIQPMQLQLDTLKLAATVLLAVPSLSTHPFAEAVQRLPDYHPQRLEELTAYLGAAGAEQKLPLSRMQGFLLYVSAHVMMLTLVTDLLDGEGLDDMLLRRGPGLDEAFDLKGVERLRNGAAIILTAYVDLLRKHERDTYDFQELEERLAPVLALAVG